MLAGICAVGRSLWQDCVILAVVCCSGQRCMLVLKEVCVVDLRVIG